MRMRAQPIQSNGSGVCVHRVARHAGTSSNTQHRTAIACDKRNDFRFYFIFLQIFILEKKPNWERAAQWTEMHFRGQKIKAIFHILWICIFGSGRFVCSAPTPLSSSLTRFIPAVHCDVVCFSRRDTHTHTQTNWQIANKFSTNVFALANFFSKCIQQHDHGTVEIGESSTFCYFVEQQFYWIRVNWMCFIFKLDQQ